MAIFALLSERNGSIAQLVQSTCLTSRGSAVRSRVLPQNNESRILRDFFMASAYILYSKSIDSYYIGSCKNLEDRLKEHSDKLFSQSFTANQASDWELFISIDELEYSQARKIENHIKRMKSKKYIQNLKEYPEMIEKLKLK